MQTLETAPLAKRPAIERVRHIVLVLSAIVLATLVCGIVLWVLGKIALAVVVVVGAVMFAYLLCPAVCAAQSRGIPAWIAIVAIYAILAIIIAAGVYFAAPRLLRESNMALHAAQDFTSSLRRAAAAPTDEQPMSEARSFVAGAAVQFLDDATATVTRVPPLAIITRTSSIVAIVFVVPIIAFYLLLDAPRLRSSALLAVPQAWRERAVSILADVDEVIKGFVRGQLIVAACLAFMIWVALLALHIHYAVLIACFAGLADMIPYAGAVTGALPAIVLAYMRGGFWFAVLTLAIFLIIYEIEGHLIAPVIVGKRVGLSPALIIITIIAGVELAGIAGALFAVPVAALIRVLWLRLVHEQVLTEPERVLEVAAC